MNLTLAERFARLDAFLIEHQSLWRPVPFTERVLPWEAEYPTLADWLRQRSLEEAEADHTHPGDLQAPAPFPHWAERARELSEVAALPKRAVQAPPARLSVDVPGRKWTQIQAFAQSIRFTQAPTHWLDWCAGKGHLGRLLALHGDALTCLEHDPALVSSGQALSQRIGLVGARHLRQDVLAEDVHQHLTADLAPVALHACGDLHVRLLHAASQAGVRHLAVAPCCYNRTAAAAYRPLSARAARSGLHLDLEALRLPMQESVTAGHRVRQQRDRSMAWRLAFDLLQRERRGVDEYLPVPSTPATWLNLSFAEFCSRLAALKTIDLGIAHDWDAREAAGWRRLARVRNLELVRGLFRRPLELWLVLDRALFLEEHGYRVELGTFCEARLTPRNLMLLAERAV